MANSLLNKSTHYIGEVITGQFIITVDTETPAVPAIDVLAASLQMIIKDDVYNSDAEALAVLTVGDGLTVTENTSTLYDVIYKIDGDVTSNLEAPTPRENKVVLYYEINITYSGETYSDVLEIGTINIRTDRVKTF
jgi:hypothetical protein